MFSSLYYVNNKFIINIIIFSLIIFYYIDFLSWVFLQLIPNEYDNKLLNFLVLILNVSLNINSFMFFVSFLLFVYLLKNTLEQITIELKIKIPEEYYIDYDNSNKNML
jgi:hypothetical protein